MLWMLFMVVFYAAIGMMMKLMMMMRMVMTRVAIMLMITFINHITTDGNKSNYSNNDNLINISHKYQNQCLYWDYQNHYLQ